MSELNMSIVGFPAVNRDLEVELYNPVTLNVLKVKPYLDGTIRVPKLDPGPYEIVVKHPNVILPVLKRPIQILPVGPTTVTVMIDPSKFRNTPIAETAEANLAPVAERSAATSESLAPLAGKTPGEAIRSADWNTLTGAVRDLAGNTADLTRLVSPVGHDHPELAAKIEEMSSNFAMLLETMSRALAELQRQIESLRLRKDVQVIFDSPAGQNIPQDKIKLIYDKLDEIDQQITTPPKEYVKKKKSVHELIMMDINELIQTTPALQDTPAVAKVNEYVELYKKNPATSYGAEIGYHHLLDRAAGAGALVAFKG